MGVPIDFIETNRFDGDYGTFIDKGADGLHPGPLHNRIYSGKLIKHIVENFPSFVPDNISLEDVKIHHKKLI
jgi:hypothetical protein